MKPIKENWEKFEVSDAVKRTKNKIRYYVENEISKIKPADKKPVVLAIGDPVIYPDFRPDPTVLAALADGVNHFSGYVDNRGAPECREFLASYYSTEKWKLDADDVILQTGGSGGLWSVTTALADPGDTILSPSPGFPLIQTICEYRGINNVTYKLVEAKDWEVDLQDLETKMQATPRPKMLLINNPSNPLGSVWSEEHIKDIMKLADKYKIPILADEIYETMVFPGEKVVSFGKLSEGQPVFVCSGTAKMCCVPGWRMGWVIMYGHKHLFTKIRKAIADIVSQVGHPSTIIQWKLKEIMTISEKFVPERMLLVEKRVKELKKRMEGIKGVTMRQPKGAMYAVISLALKHFPFATDKEFTMKFFEEEHVIVLPGELFGGEQIFRIVTLSSEEALFEFAERLRGFCERHYQE
jgi:tyrosine aminotransferase